MMQKPYQRYYHPEVEPSTQLPEQYRNLLLDQQSTRRTSYARPNVTKRISKNSKSSNSLVMRRERRSRTVFTNEQVAELEYNFMECNYVNSERAEELAAKLSLDAAPVKYWFKNQRRRIKVKKIDTAATNTEPKDTKSTSCGETVTTAPNFVCQVINVSTPSPQPTPPPSVTDVGTPYSLNPSFYSHLPKQTTGHPLLQLVATSTPTHLVQSATSVNSKISHAATSHQLSKQLSYTPVFSFHMPPMTLPTEDIHSSTTASSNSDTSDYFSQMSPNSGPLTPNSELSETDSVFNDILDSLKTPKTQPTMENIYEKLISAPEPNINCGLDTILQPYNSSHQSPKSTRSKQFTYLELV